MPGRRPPVLTGVLFGEGGGARKPTNQGCLALQEFALRLAAKQPELELTDSDLLVLEVAGAPRSSTAACQNCRERRRQPQPPARRHGLPWLPQLLREGAPLAPLAVARACGAFHHPSGFSPDVAAGLCHDLGHGPFSHSFQTELVPKLLPPGEHWCGLGC